MYSGLKLCVYIDVICTIVQLYTQVLTVVCYGVVAEHQCLQGMVVSEKVPQLHGVLVAVEHVVGEMELQQGSV